jgi:hypothetical protein
MGTPAAFAYASTTYRQHGNANILTEFAPYLLYHKHYIDDIFGIWIPPETCQQTTWCNFKERLNDWGWIIEDLSMETVFLDLNIELKQSAVHTSTFQKSPSKVSTTP